jgi:NTE family protein
MPERENDWIALCLSGGGFRASLFHLGLLRELHELGLLGRSF